MSYFLNATFGPEEFKTIRTVLEEWCQERNLDLKDPEAELAASVLINMFREGHVTASSLKLAMSKHKWFADVDAKAS